MDEIQNREWTRIDANESVKTNRRFTQIIAGRSVQLMETLFSASDEAIANRFFAQESERQVEIHSQQL